MSGWLGTINYGVITASKVDKFLRDKLSASPINEKPQELPVT
jgi:hypothetical protein